MLESSSSVAGGLSPLSFFSFLSFLSFFSRFSSSGGGGRDFSETTVVGISADPLMVEEEEEEDKVVVVVVVVVVVDPSVEDLTVVVVKSATWSKTGAGGAAVKMPLMAARAIATVMIIGFVIRLVRVLM